MSGTLRIISVLVSFTLLVLVTGPALGQFKETSEPPGYLLEWGGYGSSDGLFDTPWGVAADSSGNVYVADLGNDRIQKFDSTGNLLTKWGSSGSADGLFDEPWKVAVDASGNVYVSDSNNDRIQKFDSSGNFLTKWGSTGSGDGQFSTPAGIAVDASGNIYVADYENHRVQKFDSAGSFLTKWGSLGSGDGQFSYVSDVAVGPLGNVYVADYTNHRIQKFDQEGNFLTKWGNVGTGDGQFSWPTGVATDAWGNVYVADTSNNRVQKFDGAGNLLTKWGSGGSGDGEFNLPRGLDIDGSANIYVVDGSNQRIQKFASVLWFDVAGYDSYLSVATLHETAAVRTLFQLENNGAPRFAFKNTSSDIEWSFQQSGPGNFLISKEGTGGPEMQVYQTGMVRMGPGGTNNFTLYPNGNLVIAGSLTANGSTFPDYVFDPDYDLMSLSELRSFIERERHLPEIPSAEEVQQQGGHNMTELQLKLLEKIEELTLYLLEQEKKLGRVESLEWENARMKVENAEMRAELAEIRKMLSNR